MRTSETKLILFRYNYQTDRKNCIIENNHGQKFSTLPIEGGKDLIDLLAASQPASIFEKGTISLRCYGARSALLKRAIVLPNSYELFLSPWQAEGSFSYPDHLIREDWKKWFPGAHHARYLSSSGFTANIISADKFDGAICLFSKKPKYIIKNHVDANNYWHWTFEWLPRLLILKELLDQKGHFQELDFINIGPSLNSFQMEWLYLLFGKSVEVSNYNSPILCENLLWITPPFPAHHCQNTILQIRSHILAAHQDGICRGNLECPARIYLLRGKARNGRKVRNESEVIAGLKKYGFVPMAMDNLSVYEQAQIFSNAQIIVGAHGSAFVNMIYCEKSCRIIELFGPGYVSGHDYSLAFVCGLHWEYIEGEAVDANPSFLSDYTINSELLCARAGELLVDSTCL